MHTNALAQKAAKDSDVFVDDSLKRENKLKFPQDFINKIICGDSVEVMKQIPDGTVDFVVTSPPYNLKNSTGNGMKDGRGGKWANAALQYGYTHHDDCMPHEEYVKWQRACLTEMLLRTLIDNGITEITWQNISGRKEYELNTWMGYTFSKKFRLNFNAGYYLPTYEVIYLIAKPKFKLVPKANAYGDVWEFTQEMNNDHPAAFPVNLIDRIISSTNAKLVLDPFMGSGTTAISAINFKRDYIGIDISPEYCGMARDRIKKHRAQTKLW
ncbi:MAG: site-specific DNA-methyltransferase [Candidatus Saganbacteria bacterium]|nr:site-specific DNA-methyltransferase [Candidatus Saganbacteria bacterium]